MEKDVFERKKLKMMPALPQSLTIQKQSQIYETSLK